MEDKEKLSDVCHEDFREVQPYMKNNSVEQARMKFSLCAKMYNCRANLHGKYDEEDRGCPACAQAQASKGGGVQDRLKGRGESRAEEESQSHLSICPQYAHLRVGLDRTTTEGMVAYFQSVLKERDKKRELDWSRVECTCATPIRHNDFV